MVIDDVGMM